MSTNKTDPPAPLPARAVALVRQGAGDVDAAVALLTRYLGTARRHRPSPDGLLTELPGDAVQTVLNAFADARAVLGRVAAGEDDGPLFVTDDDVSRAMIHLQPRFGGVASGKDRPAVRAALEADRAAVRDGKAGSRKRARLAGAPARPRGADAAEVARG